MATIIVLVLFGIPNRTHIINQPSSLEKVRIVAPVSSEVPELLQKIAWCESRNRQFKSDGTLYRGIVNSKDVGKYQINEFYHLEASQKLGMNIYTEKGNTEYALYLFKHQGSKPWDWSKPCWGDPKRVWESRNGMMWSTELKK